VRLTASEGSSEVDQPTGAPRPRLSAAARTCLVPLGVWSVWQIVLVATGARFSTGPLDISWQIIPLETLRRDPLGSVWYLHIQPPVWNLVVGLVTRVSPISDALSLQLLLLSCSALVVVLLADLLRRMGFPDWACIASASVVAVDPELIRYAYEPAYEVPSTMLVVLAVWAGVRLIERPTTRRAIAFSGGATALALTRSLFHPVWLAALLAIVLVALRRRLRPRAVVVCLLIPLVLVGGWMLKNRVLFGEATTSSWSGMNLQRAVISPLPADDLAALAADGTVSQVAVIGPFKSYADYVRAVGPCTPAHTHPAVNRPERANGVPNFNYECYLPVYRQAGRDAWAVAVHRPGVWWKGRTWAGRATFVEGKGSAPTASSAFRLSQKVFHLLFLAKGGALSWAGWAQPIFGPRPVRVRYLLMLVAGFAVLVGRGAIAAVRLVRRRGRDVTEGGWALAAGISLSTLAVGVVAELGEQFRFRPLVEPLLVGLPLAWLFGMVRARVSRRFG
jgi:hypothetical protein